MADKYYLDFVGLNTFIYEYSGYEATFLEKKINTVGGYADYYAVLNHVGIFFNSDGIPTPSVSEAPLSLYKNTLFSHELPNTASFFPALMLHRNGPYGHPTWKQVRASHNPLIRKQIKNNVFTHIEEPGPQLLIQGAQVTQRYGNISAYTEVPVISRFKPLLTRASDGQNQLQIKSSMGNAVCHFNNPELDKYYGFQNCSNEEYNEIKKLYLNGGLENPDSPINEFSKIVYSETVYPTQLYTNKSYTRQRTTFSFDWRDDRENRTEGNIDNGLGTTVPSQSVWPLDTGISWGLNSNIYHSLGLKSLFGIVDKDYGILQNNYSTAIGALDTYVDDALINDHLAPAPIYNRKHSLTPSASVVSQNGMTIAGITDGSGVNLDSNHVFSGEAKWEAGDQAGKNPFYDSYDDYVQGVRQRGKGYTIVPEFRISNHIPTIVAEGIDKKFSNMFEITGGLSTADGSDEENFFKVYSTTEFLKHFDLIKEDHKEFVDPTKIKLKCKAIKKFLPYNGFYPCQRTVEIAQQFYSSYAGSTTVATGSSFDFQPLTDSAKIGFQNLLAPLFAPGVLFNAIKSGVACDYPIVTSSIDIEGRVLQDGDNYYLMKRSEAGSADSNTIFDKRIPFNALVEPQRYLAQQPIFCNEPHINANHSSSVYWDGNGDNLYKMMAHNFLAEVPDFFLQGQQFSTIYSKPSNDPNVGNALSGSTYKMRVKMFKTVSGSSNPVFSGSSPGNNDYFSVPQYSSDVTENFTMYSRPSAFGPPSRTSSSFVASVPTTGSNSDIGENYPFTPPYYYGQGWADIEFTATETKKYTIDEIIRDSEVTYWRYVDSNTEKSLLPTTPARIKNFLYNSNAMQLSASVNLFAQGEIKSVDLLDDSTSDKVNVAVDISSDNKSRWIIQSYFETPMLNFNHLSASDSVTLPTYGSQSVPRGMWHQYGRIETDTNKGIFLQVTDIPDDFRIKVSGSVLDNSLAKLCGFNDEPKRLGQVAQSKVVSEAVVAIPFIEEEGQRKFFKLDPKTIRFIKEAQSLAEGGSVSQNILDMVDKMRKFVIPPSFDFVHREDIEPFAMYIFEFNHTLNQQDLADIWQNLPPTIGRSFEEAEASISHNLLAHELLGGGETIISGEKKKGPPLSDRIKWMVFKAKQRAETNYYDKIVGESQTAIGSALATQTTSILRPEGVDVNVSYNWPYDFFSLVELVKIDAEVTLADTEVVKEEDNDVVPKVPENSVLADLQTRPLGRGRE